MTLLVIIICVLLGVKCMSYRAEISTILFTGLVLRIFVLISDVNHWFPVFGSGVDSEAFNYYAKIIAQTGRGFELTHYTVFLAVIYKLTDCSRLFAQSVNLIFGMGVLFIAARTLKLIGVPIKRQKRALWILAILPNLVIYSGILLREAWVEFFVALSLLEFTKWYVSGNKLRILTTTICVCCGIYMHDGVIALLGGYILAFVMYNPLTGKIQMSFTTIVLICIFGIGYVSFSDSFMGEKSEELVNLDSGSLLLKCSNQDATGNSGYLTWLPKTTNPIVGLLFAPLKMIYFMFSPLPTEWRRITDIVGFFIDSIFYVSMWYVICKYRPVGYLQSYKKCILIAIFTAVFMFSYGTLNAGTAFRHRAKFCEPIAVIYAISLIPRKGTKPL